jgi:hypothetical protein
MNNKTCGECKHYGDASFKDPCAWVHATFDACFEFEPMTEPKLTNGDKIRQMTNEELAELLADNTCTDCGFFVINQDGTEGCTMTTKDTCKDGKLAWLNAPVGK